jgi:hypothetical protein
MNATTNEVIVPEKIKFIFYCGDVHRSGHLGYLVVFLNRLQWPIMIKRGAAEFFPARFRILYGTAEFK